MKIEYYIKDEITKEKIFNGDDVCIRNDDGGGRRGIITKITNKGIYLEVGNKNPKYISINNIKNVRKII